MCKHAVQVIERLYEDADWETNIMYSVNIPSLVGLAREIAWTSIYNNSWQKPQSFEELEPVAKKEKYEDTTDDRVGDSVDAERTFKWVSRLDVVVEENKDAPEGTDAWAIHQGKTSITKINANYMYMTGM
ncbi:hypothetical protein E4T38_04693 [Aureobasidium subglaciale]|nr:hypothetical protein E4T38_04693 [Aureobasidium subglaciale]